MHARLLLLALAPSSASRLGPRVPQPRVLRAPTMGFADMLSHLVGKTEPAQIRRETAPSWEQLHLLWSDKATEHERGFRERLAAGTGQDACHLATIRLFDGTKEDAERVVLYRDTVTAVHFPPTFPP